MRRLAASSGYWSSDVAPPPGFTIAVPGSDLLDQDIFHGRRAFLGGSLARHWWSFVQGGTTFVVTYVHLQGANPALWVPALAFATIITVDLGLVARTPTEVGSLTETALVSATISGVSRVGAAISIANATSPQLGPAGDPRQPSLRGMWGIQRTDYGVGFDGLGYTPAIATTLRHILSPGRGRILGMFVYGRTSGADYLPRLAVGRSGPYSPAPVDIEILAQGVIIDPVQEGLPSYLIFDTPIAIDVNENLVVLQRANAGEVAFRLESANPSRLGNFSPAEVLIADEVISDPSTPFGATYTPTVSGTFASVPTMGLLFALEDGSGNYPADGALRTRIGDQNNDAAHGVQGTAGPGIITLENLEFRFPFPQWTDFFAVGDDWVVAALDPGDDMGSKMYLWADLDVPATGAVPFLADLGPVGIDVAGEYYSRTYATPVAVGTNVIGDNQIVGYGVNFGRTGGGGITGLVATFFADTNAGDNNYQNAWSGTDQDDWHDYVPVGGGGYGSAALAPTEYAARGANGSLMPTQNPNPAWPANYLVDSTPPTDVPLINIPVFRQYVIRPGFSLS